MTIGNSDAVTLGAGFLYAAPLATTDPADGTTALASAWREIGFTEDGSEFQYALTAEDVFVAESFDPVKIATTTRAASVTFQMAENTRQNLALALNVGANEVNDGTAFEPPDVGTEVRIKLVWQNWDNDDAPGDAATDCRWIFRQCFQGAPITTAHRKAPQKGLIPVTFRLELPSAAKLFKVFPTSSGLIA